MPAYSKTMNSIVTPFNRKLVRLRRERGAPTAKQYDFLLRHTLDELADRLTDIKRDFRRVLLLGCHAGIATTLFADRQPELIVNADLAQGMAARAGGLAVVADEEFLPFAPASFDLMIAPLTLHWVGDLPGTLLQIRQILKPDGLFLGAMIGGDTLWELRQVMMQAESETAYGVSPRVSPFADMRDLGGLLQRAAFALPVVDSDTVTVSYANLFALVKDLRGMAATSAPFEGSRPLRRATLFRAAELYQNGFAEEGRISARFQIIHLAGWAPHESQQQALRPGSAKIRLADVLGTEEVRTSIEKSE